MVLTFSVVELSRFPVQAPQAPDAHPRLDTRPLEAGTTPISPGDGDRDEVEHAPVVESTPRRIWRPS